MNNQKNSFINDSTKFIFMNYCDDKTSLIHFTFTEKYDNLYLYSKNLKGYIVTDNKMNIIITNGDSPPQVIIISRRIYKIYIGTSVEKYIDIESGLTWSNMEDLMNYLIK